VQLEGVQARLDLAERQVAARDALLAEMKGALAERDSAIRRQAAHVGQLEQHIRWAALEGAASAKQCASGIEAVLQCLPGLQERRRLFTQGHGRRAAAAAAAAGRVGGALRRG
jgi:uncharacterized coiled-coil protein SlyX